MHCDRKGRLLRCGGSGLGAIPINDAADIANELITKGYVVSGKAYMGVSIDNRYTSVHNSTTACLRARMWYNVESGGCAEKIGSGRGDIITKVGSEAIGGYFGP